MTLKVFDQLKKLTCSIALYFGIVGLTASLASAQSMPTGQGTAFRLDLQKLASEVDPRDAYARALYDYLRSNPVQWEDPTFFVNFVIYLISKHPGIDCDAAFANEFERRDYFTAIPAMKNTLRQIVTTTRLPTRFDVGYVIETGEYDFQNSILPFTRISGVSLNGDFSYSLNSDHNARSCAAQILQGTDVDQNAFPWEFRIVDETQKQTQPQFPFGKQLSIAPNDARTLFERFGRELFAIVSYSFRAAANGDRLVMIVPTDGQLFGLGNDAVVRVKTHVHPTMSQPGSFDFTNPLTVTLPEIDSTMEMAFTQEGFRAVGTGTRDEKGTSLTVGRTFEVNGSAAVGQSAFVMRLETAGLTTRHDYADSKLGRARQVTFFGSVDFSRATSDFAPVSGTAFIERIDRPAAVFSQHIKMAFDGGFIPQAAASSSAVEENPTNVSSND